MEEFPGHGNGVVIGCIFEHAGFCGNGVQVKVSNFPVRNISNAAYPNCVCEINLASVIRVDAAKGISDCVMGSTEIITGNSRIVDVNRWC